MAFFQDEKPPHAPFFNAPGVLLALIGVIVAAHLGRVFAPEPWPDMILWRYAFIPARLVMPLLTPEGVLPNTPLDQYLPFVSHIFLHGGYEHLAINCLWLLAFGAPVARRLGALRFLAFFLVCGIFGALVQLAGSWGSNEPMVGASGAISGVMAAAIRIVYGQRAAMIDAAEGRPAAPKLAPAFSSRVMIFTLLWIVTNALAAATGLGLSDPTQSVAWLAHLGGYFAGLFLISIFDARAKRGLNSDAIHP